MRISLNLPGITAHRYYEVAQQNLQTALERLSSGYRINSAADDPSGLAVAVKFRSQLGGIVQAQTNVETGISLLQTAQGGLQEIVSILEDLYANAVEAANGTLTATDRTNIQGEVDQMLTEVDRISATTEFNQFQLLRGEVDPAQLHVGPAAGDLISIAIGSTSTTLLGLSGLDVTTAAAAESAITTLNAAISQVTASLADLGASENRLSHAASFLGASELATTAGLAAIQDADLALEMINYTKNQLLVQSSAAMISQANLNAGKVLELLGITNL